MIQMQSMLDVADNSGAKKVMCIKVLGGAGRMIAGVSDVIKVSIKSAIPNGKVKKGEVYDALIVRCKSSTSRIDGGHISFDNNSVVLLDKQLSPIGTRVFGPVPRELRRKNFVKIISLAEEVL